MRKLYMLTQEETGRLMQFNVLKTEQKPILLSDVKPGYYGCLVEMVKSSNGILQFEDCATVSIPVGNIDDKLIYKPIYLTNKSSLLRGSIFI